MGDMRIGTIVRFTDGRVAVKKVSGLWEVSGTTMVRVSDRELEEFTVVYVPPRDVSGYRVGTAVLVGGDVFVKTSQTVVGWEISSEWMNVNGEAMTDAELAATDYIELYLGGTL